MDDDNNKTVQARLLTRAEVQHRAGTRLPLSWTEDLLNYLSASTEHVVALHLSVLLARGREAGKGQPWVGA